MKNVVLYGCETWSITWCLRIFGRKRDEVTEWRKLHNVELHNLYTSPNIIRQIIWMRMGRACYVTRMGEECVQGFGGEVRRKETTRKTEASMEWWGQNWSRGDWLGCVEWIQLAQDRGRWLAVMNAVMNLRFWRHGVSSLWSTKDGSPDCEYQFTTNFTGLGWS
jgi:hypothetical protein